VNDCGCDPLAPVPPETANPPGQARLHRRVATHATALTRMRIALGAAGGTPAMRALARRSTEDPAIALLDAWAVVADVVAFYSERIAEEGLLRTATERRSVRELARMLGHELRPGVSAQVELAFSAETAPGAPASCLVPRGTPVQSVPGPGEQPQTFETAADLEVRGAWNDIPVVSAEPQHVGPGAPEIWLRGATTPVRPGDVVLVVAADRRDLRIVDVVEPDPAGRRGWTRLGLLASDAAGQPEVSPEPTTVHAFTDRASLFGWNAPDPTLLVTDRREPPGAELIEGFDPPRYRWADFAVDPDELELDGERTSIRPGPESWIVAVQPELIHVTRVTGAVLDGASRFALSGRVTRVTLETPLFDDSLPDIPLRDRPSRRRLVVHCGPVRLPADERPATAPVGGRQLLLRSTGPLLPPGRTVLVTGDDAATGTRLVEEGTVVTCAVDGDRMVMDLADDLAGEYRPETVSVRGNVVRASHGETVVQVLGSGNGAASFLTFRPRRVPVTHLRSTSDSTGARPELTVRVDGVAWNAVPSLDEAGPHDPVYSLRYDEEGGARIVFGNGVHGARPPTGEENLTATYRVGIGAPGGVGADSLTLMARRPMGVREVTNPAPARDWAPAEELADARTSAPARIRALGRAVSLADHEDLARGYAGVGPARADLLWDGRRERVAVTLLGTGGGPVSPGLVVAVRDTLSAVRDPGTTLHLVAGEVRWFGLRLALRHDPAHERAAVVDRVRAALESALGRAGQGFAGSVTSAAALVVVGRVPGVVAATLPRLLEPPLPATGPVTGTGAGDVLTAEPARWAGGVRAAQLLALLPGAVEIAEMTT
jgi:hypothetical protein